jgi:hypothetical protein
MKSKESANKKEWVGITRDNTSGGVATRGATIQLRE